MYLAADAMLAVPPSEKSITAFSRDAITGALTFVEAETGGPGLGTTSAPNVAISPDGAFLYSSDHQGKTVSWFSRDAGTGALSVASTSSMIDNAFVAAIAPDGNHLYGGTFIDDSTDRPPVYRLLTYARALAVSGDGAHVYLGHSGGAYPLTIPAGVDSFWTWRRALRDTSARRKSNKVASKHVRLFGFWLAVGLLFSPTAPAGVTTRVSVTSEGSEAQGTLRNDARAF